MFTVPNWLIGLYYPYGMPIHAQTLKKALLYFDEVWLLDSLPFDQRKKGFDDMELNVWGLQEDLYNKSIEIFKGNASIILSDVSEAIDLGAVKVLDATTLIPFHDKLLTQGLNMDINDPHFVQMTLDDHVFPWHLLAERTPSSFIEKVDESSEFEVSTVRAGSLKLIKMSPEIIALYLTRQFAASGFCRLFTDNFTRLYGMKIPLLKTKVGTGLEVDMWYTPYRHIMVPFAYGASIHLNQSFVIAEQKDLMPFTDESTFNKLLTYKYRSANLNFLRNPDLLSLPTEYRLLEKMYESILAIRIIDIAFPLSIEDLTIKQVLLYKHEAKPELNRFREYVSDAVNAIIAQGSTEDYSEETTKSIFQNVLPELSSLKNKMREIYSDLFASLAKKGVLTLGAASTSGLVCKLLSGLSAAEIIAIGGAITTSGLSVIASELIDVYQKQKKLRRHHLAYFLS